MIAMDTRPRVYTVPAVQEWGADEHLTWKLFFKGLL